MGRRGALCYRFAVGTTVGDKRKSLSSVQGLDTLRFVAAAWVAFSHGAAPPLKSLPGAAEAPLSWLAGGLEATFNGTAAVVVFFLISGFCIHLPNVGSQTLDWPRFLVRRFVRISIPLLVIAGLVRALGDRFVAAEDAVLWSVYCEIVYYGLYPALFLLLKRVPVGAVTLGAFAVSAVLLAFNPQALFLWHFGPLTWAFCAPFWLLGAWLAELHANEQGWRVGSIWIWRAGAVALSLAATVALYHLPIRVGLAWSMPPFAVYCLIWLRREVAHGDEYGACRGLEMLGAASYSLYLMHKVVLEGLGAPSSFLEWLIVLAAIGGATAALYLLVEYPSHQLARRLGRRRPAASGPATAKA